MRTETVEVELGKLSRQGSRNVSGKEYAPVNRRASEDDEEDNNSCNNNAISASSFRSVSSAFKDISPNTRCLLCLFGLFALCIISAYFFKHFELDNEKAQAALFWKNHDIVQNLLERSRNGTASIITKEEREAIEFTIGQLSDCHPAESENYMDWTLRSSFFFTATVISTIGYGNFTPETTGGKLYTGFLCVFGVAYFGFCLTIISERLVTSIQCTYKWISGTKNISDKRTFFLILSCCLGYILAVACFGLLFEGFSYVNSLYFSIVTFSTVGLGDIVPDFNRNSFGRFMIFIQYAGMSLFCLAGISLLAALLRSFERYWSSISVVGVHLARDMAGPRLEKVRNRLSNLTSKGESKE